MNKSIISIPLFLFLIFAITSDSSPCSVVGGYIPPTNFELVKTSDAILLCQAKKNYAFEREKGDKESFIEFSIKEILKDIKSVFNNKKNISLEGYTNEYYGKGKKYDFSKARPGAYTGGCIAHDYALEKYYLLFFYSNKKIYHIRSTTFCRVNEEVDEKNDPWVYAVMEYIRISKIDGLNKQHQEMKKIIKRGKSKGANKIEQELSRDLQYHLKTATPYKSFKELKIMYNKAIGSRKKDIIQVIGNSNDKEALSFMKKQIKRIPKKCPTVKRRYKRDYRIINVVSAYFKDIYDNDTIVSLSHIFLKTRPCNDDVRWQIIDLLLKQAKAKHKKLLLQIMAKATDKEFETLSKWFIKHPSAKVTARLKTLLKNDYYEKYDIALILSAMGDESVLEWAIKEIKLERENEDLWVPFYIIGRSPLKKACYEGKKIIKKQDNNLESFIQSFSKAHHDCINSWINQLKTIKNLDKNSKYWLNIVIEDID